VKWALVAITLVVAGCNDSAGTQYLPIGSRCSNAMQCGTAPFTCNASGYPNGYCEKPCTTDGDCPADSLCSPVAKACRRRCSDDTACRTSEGYVCVTLPGGNGVCEPGTTMDGGQPSG
jgi:hypothetical protein